jgi:hypothetical protein
MSRLARQRVSVSIGARYIAPNLIFLTCILYLWLTSSLLYAQDVTATPFAPPINAGQADIVNAYLTTENLAPLVGDIVEVTLIVEAPAGVQIANLPEFPTDDIFAVLEKGVVSTEIRTDGITVYSQILKMIIWLPGQHLTPEIPVTFTYNGASMSNPVKSLFFTVPSVLETAPDRSLRPLVPPIELPYISPLWVVPVIMILGTGVYGLRRLFSRRNGRIAGIIGGTPAQIAIAELEDLKAQSLPAATIYLLVADKLRGYLYQVHQLNAAEMTTAELNHLLKESGQFPDNLRKGLSQVLEQADLVKFARFEPETDAAVRLVNYAIRWLQAIEKAS